MKHQKKKIKAGVYEYRGLTLSKLPRSQGYYGGTAFQNDGWIIQESYEVFKYEALTLNHLCEYINEWLDDSFWAKGHPVRDAHNKITDR
tara:strand:- start:1085 stop:1351 length:267 start_codon:yes stop_codon:yes gene_type:complete